MTDMTGKFGALETQLGVEHGETMDALDRIQGEGDGSIVDLLNALNLNTSTLVDIRSLLSDLRNGILTLNDNARQAQTIALGAYNSCCVDPAPGTGFPDMMCEKSQELISLVALRLGLLATTVTPGELPTVDQIYDAFTVVADDGRTYPLLPRADCGMLLGALAQLGATSIGDLSNLILDDVIRTAVLDLLGTSNSAEQSVNRIRLLATSGYSTSAGAAKVFFYAFTVSLINTLWKDPPIWLGEGFEDICGGEPEPGGTGYDVQTRLILNDGEETLQKRGDFWDLGDDGVGGLSPIPWPSGSAPLYVHYCLNNTTWIDNSILITNSPTDPESVVLHLFPGDTLSLDPANDRLLYFWSYGRPFFETVGLLGVSIGWTVEDAESHCPE